MPTQISMMTISRPLPSPPSYLYVHMPSLFSSQYAPVALCMPRRPTCGLPSVLVASALVETCGSSALTSVPPRALFRADVGTRCCTMVLLQANLYCEWAPCGVASEMTSFRREFCERHAMPG